MQEPSSFNLTNLDTVMYKWR